MKFDEEKPEAYAWRMNIETRLEKIEADLASIKLDIALLKANSATKTDIAELRTQIAEAKSSIIIWVVGAVFIGQLLPQLLKQFFG
jgi:hypothetical protein